MKNLLIATIVLVVACLSGCDKSEDSATKQATEAQKVKPAEPVQEPKEAAPVGQQPTLIWSVVQVVPAGTELDPHRAKSEGTQMQKPGTGVGMFSSRNVRPFLNKKDCEAYAQKEDAYWHGDGNISQLDVMFFGSRKAIFKCISSYYIMEEAHPE